MIPVGPQSWHHGLVARWWSLFRDSGPEIDYFRQFVEAGQPGLDVGCGSGRLLVLYVEAGLDVDGCDLSPDMVALCREAAEAVGGSPNLYCQEKELAAPNFKGGFGFHPVLVWLDNTNEALAGLLRAGNAGANTAADHVRVLDLALAQIPDDHRYGTPILIRADGAPTATYDSPLDWIREVLFLSYLLASIGSLRLAARSGLATRWPALLVSVGYGLISVGAAYGMVTREDPDWFFFLAGPGQLLAIVGFIWFAIKGFRRRVLPGWAALLAGAGGTVAIIMAELGSSVLIGAFWLWVASQSRRP